MPTASGGLQRVEISARVAEMRNLLFKDDVQASLHRRGPVLEHLDGFAELGLLKIGEILRESVGAIEAHRERIGERRIRVAIETGPWEVETARVRQTDRVELAA